MIYLFPNSKIIEVIILMNLRTKNKEFSKSMKFFHPQPLLETRTEEHVPMKSAIDEKIDLLRAPVYERKKVFKKPSSHLGSYTEKIKASNHKNNMKPSEDQKQKDNQVYVRGHYRHRSSHTKKTTFQSWFRKTSGNLEDTGVKKNIIDIVVLEKEFERDLNPIYERTNSMMNLKEKPSKSLLMNQDSQSLLRKNSLYLLNFIKRKESQSRECEPHIGGIPNLASNIRLCFSPSKAVRYTPSKPQKVKKPEKIVSAYSKIVNSLPIDPW